jgi:hypothetical protein
MEASLNETQIKYLCEIGIRTLISMGVYNLPDQVHVPSEEEKDELAKIGQDFKKSLN